jgi:hypothetical protein
MLDHIAIQVRDIGAATTYFGAFVRDPDGNNIEACCHRPE